MFDVSLLINTVKGIAATLGKLREISRSMEQVELKATVAELANELADLQLYLSELKNEMSEIREENALLKGREASEKPKVSYGCYKFPEDENLYCPGCYDTKGRKHLMVPTGVGKPIRLCSVCQLEIGW